MASIGKLPQLHVALQQCSVVFEQRIEIKWIELRNDTVNKLASKLTTFINEITVVRRNHHQREFPDVFGKSVVFFLVEFERLLGIAFLHARNQLILFVVESVSAMDTKEILIVADVELVGGAKKTLAKRKVVNGIEDVGLPCPVEANETVHILRKRQLGALAVLEIGQSQFLQIHLELAEVNSDSKVIGGKDDAIACSGVADLKHLDFDGHSSRETHQSTGLWDGHRITLAIVESGT